MPWNIICRRCGNEYSLKDYQISRFCVNCGSLLEKVWIERKVELKNSIPVLEPEKIEVAKYIVEIYAKERKAFGDLEEKLLQDIDVETVDGRFEVIILAILFSEWAMREERAYHLWKKIISWFRSRNLSYSGVLLGKDSKNIMEFEDL